MFPALDLPALLGGLAAAITCSLIGNFLLLRKQVMLSDAVSHAVFPGIVAAYFLLGSASVAVMVGGSLVAAFLAVILIYFVNRILSEDVSIGLVFTNMFALGVLLLEQGNRAVHLDVEDALFGYMEGIIWPELAGDVSFSLQLLKTMPYELALLLACLAITALTLSLFHKQLLSYCLDRDFASSLRLADPSLPLLTVTCLAAVAGFNAVGAILIIAMFACPPSTALYLSDRFATRVWLSVGLATAATLLGYAAAVFAPQWLSIFGLESEHSLSAAGCIALLMAMFQLAVAARSRWLASTIFRHARLSSSSSRA